MRISKFNGRARVSRLARLARERNATATPRGSERRSVSDIVKRSSSPTRTTSTTTASDTATRCESRRAAACRRGAAARVARPDVVSRASTRFLYTIRQFLFSLPSGLCVLDVCFSLVHSVADCCERASQKTLDAEQDLRNVNDPSAGSPTETLLRLLLPLNDQVWSSSRQHRQCRDIAAHQSEDLTKSFNR